MSVMIIQYNTVLSITSFLYVNLKNGRDTSATIPRKAQNACNSILNIKKNNLLNYAEYTTDFFFCQAFSKTFLCFLPSPPTPY